MSCLELSDKCNLLKVSATLRISSKAKFLKLKGKQVFDLTIGEPDFKTPKYIIDSAIEAMEKGLIKYTDTAGIYELRKAISNDVNKKNQTNFNFKNIIIGNGAKQCIMNALFTITSQYDEVLIPSPYWVSYPEMVKLADGIPRIIKTDKSTNYKINAEILDEYKTKRTKAIIINDPSNPTGTIYTKEELLSISRWCVKNKIYIIYDEIYDELSYDNDFIGLSTLNSEVKGLEDISICINGFSKSYAMTGWRIGYAYAKEEIIENMSKFQGHTTSNASAVSQYAALGALLKEDKNNEIKNMFQTFKRRRNMIVKKLDGYGIEYIYPKATFYVFINIEKLLNKYYDGKIIKDSFDITDILLDKFSTAVLPGKVFGNDNFIRISFASSDYNIENALKNINKLIKDVV